MLESSKFGAHGQLKRQATAIPNVFVGASFHEIKKSIINWLSSQNEFKDYNFEGSRINVLIDLLAYNTLYMQHFANTAIYESFLGTANLRSSVIQAAQDNSYLPDSMTAARATILLKVSHALNPTSIRIPKGTKFLAYVESTTQNPYMFVSLDDVVAIRDNDNKYNPVLNLAQGRIVRTQTSFDSNERLYIRDDNVDRDTIRVFVNGAEWTNWTRKSTVLLGSTSSVFYLRETLEGYTEIYFGEGEQSVSTAGGVLQSNYIGGLKPTKGSSIVIEYIVTTGAAANGAVGFSYADTIQYITVDEVIENHLSDQEYTGAIGGGDREDVERIRELAQVKRESQMRCVTAMDYNAFISERFGSIIQAVNTFTDSNKPGYAFIAVKPKHGLLLTSTMSEDIQNYIKGYNVATITPVVVYPDYIFISKNINIKYDVNKLQESEQWLRSKVVEKIDRYYIEEVEIFNKSLSKSKLLSYIDSANNSILGSKVDMRIVKEYDNFYTSPDEGVKFYNPVLTDTIQSQLFTFYNTKANDMYSVGLLCSSRDSRLNSSVIIGPFIKGDITSDDAVIAEQTNEFQFTPHSHYDPKIHQYFKVGEVTFDNKMKWNLGSLGHNADAYEQIPNIIISATPIEDTVFTSDGAMIVFENDLRPDYLNIELEGVNV